MGCESYKRRLAYSVTVRISAQNNFILLLKSFITRVLEYKAILNRQTKFVCVAMCSLVMSLCSCDVINPLMAVAAIWRFEVITRTVICLNPADMYLYAFQCLMRLF